MLNPKNDYVFKRIFGRPGNESITKSFISSVLNKNITDVVLESDASLPKDILDDNEEVKKAKEVLDELSQNEHERRLAELREKYIMDQKATEAAGYDKGMERGMERGIEQGEKNKTIELAKKMKSQGLDNETIQKITDLSIEEINNL